MYDNLRDNTQVVRKNGRRNEVSADFSTSAANIKNSEQVERLLINKGTLQLFIGTETIKITPLENVYDANNMSELKEVDAIVTAIDFCDDQFYMSFDVSEDTYKEITKYINSSNSGNVAIKLSADPFDEKQYPFVAADDPNKVEWGQIITFKDELHVSTRQPEDFFCNGNGFGGATCSFGGVLRSKSVKVSYVTGSQQKDSKEVVNMSRT